MRFIHLPIVIAALSFMTMRAYAEPSDAERETARSLMDDADRLRASGDLWGALERFRAADQIMHAPTTALELARIQASLSQLVEARSSALAAATSRKVQGEAAVYATARKDAAKLAAELAPRVPDITVIVEPPVAGARISLDGTALPQFARPLPFKLNPGVHILEVEAPGYAVHSRQFSLVESQHLELSIELESKIPAEPADEANPQPAPAAVDLQVKVEPEPDTAGRTRGYIGLAAGGVVLALGVITGIAAASKTSAIRDACGGYACPVELRSDLVQAYTLANLSNVSVPVGLLGIAYGVYELLTQRSVHGEHVRGSGVQLSLTVDRPGVSLRGAL